MALTGRFTFRRTLTGKIVLQLEEEVKAVWPMSRKGPFRKRWRNATLMDLAAPELRPLMDMRFRPNFMAQYEYLMPEAAQAPAQPGTAPKPQAFDGIPVDKAKVLGAGAAPADRPAVPDVTVEVQSYNGRIAGHA
ncbi:MAG TPA: hypothetical protein VHL98_23285 [Microvirga sp.]|jgi:hypothetical protein|nr:hypothetical protein [Microvirga sp.]